MENNIFKKKQKKNYSAIIINAIILALIALILITQWNSLSSFFKNVALVFSRYSNYFLSGFKTTILLSFLSVAIGTILGVLIYLLRTNSSKVSNAIAKAFVEIIRGTPMMVQVFIAFIGGNLLFDFRANGIPISTAAFILGLIAVTINSGAYVSEIIRSGIESISKGQIEAGRSLGLSQSLTMRKIVFPQAVKNILPALGNEFITIIKETSVVSVIGTADLMYNTNIVKGNSFRPMEALIISAIMYFVITFTLSLILRVFERRMKESD